MTQMQVNYIAVLAAGVICFIVGGLWYSLALFAKKWVQLLGKTQEESNKARTP